MSEQSRRTVRPWYLALGVALAFQFAGAAISTAQAQQKGKVLPVPAAPNNGALRQALSAGTANKTVLANAVEFHLASLTDTKEQAKLAEHRNFIKYKLMIQAGRAPSMAAHDFLVKSILDFAKPMVGKDFHPYVRVNAMLIIADLNQVEPASSGRVPPVPSDEALKFMLDVLEDASQLEAVRGAALLGIDRSCRFGVKDPQVLTRLQTTLIKLAVTATKTEGNAYLRKKAIRSLAWVADPAGALTLYGLAKSDAEPLAIRTEAFRALGYIDLRKVSSIDLVEAVHVGGRLAVLAGKETGPKWTDLEKLGAFQMYLGCLDVGLHGADPRLHNPAVDGKPKENSGLEAAFKAGQPNVVTSCEATLAMIDPLISLIFNTERQLKAKELTNALESLDTYLKSNPPGEAPKVAGAEPAKK